MYFARWLEDMPTGSIQPIPRSLNKSRFVQRCWYVQWSSMKLLLFGGHHSLEAWGSEGRVWQSPRLSWEGFEIMEVSGDLLHGTGWDMMTDSDVTFTVDLRTGETV